MELSYEILCSRIPGFNKNSHNEFDFHELRQLLNCDFHEKKQNKKGYYAIDNDDGCIFIDSRIGGLLRCEVLFHELSHAHLDHPVDFLKHKQDFHAEIFALIFLIPKQMLLDYMELSFEEIDPRLVPYLIRRKYIYEIFGV